MAHVDLCSGIGGFALGFEWAGLSKPVLFCDIEPWSRKILKKHWPDVPQCEDVKELADDPDRYVPRNLDWSNTILTAGYPCQPFSVAGRQRGTEDPRHIWPWLLKIVALKRPKFCVFENVNGHIALGLDKVIHDLEGEDYAVTTLIIPASSVGAPHKRERLWIIAANMANTQSARTWQNDSGLRQGVEGIDRGQGTNVADTRCEHGSKGNTADLDKDTAKRSASAVHHQSSGARQPNDVANTQSSKRWPRQEPKQQKGDAPRQPISNGSGNVADTDSKRGCSWNTEGQDAEDVRQSPRSQGQDTRRMAEGQPQPRMGDLADGLSKGLDRFGRHDGFEVEPSDIPRVASGIKDRANRLKGLGNAIVPQIAMQIALAIKETQWK